MSILPPKRRFTIQKLTNKTAEDKFNRFYPTLCSSSNMSTESQRSMSELMLRFACGLLLVIGALRTANAQTPAATEILLKRSQNLQILALGERHWSITEHQFVQSLIRDVRFSDTFSVIVVEFGNALYQDVIDRYIAGEIVSDDELKRVWQDTTVPMAWDCRLYPMFFQLIRDLNQTLAKAKRIRVLLGDPPIDWSKVHTVSEFSPFMDRDNFYAGVVARNCQKGHCLLICGTNHFYWEDPLVNIRPPSSHKNVLEYYLQNGGTRSKIEVVLPVVSSDKALTNKEFPALFNAHLDPFDRVRFGEIEQGRVTILKKTKDGITPFEVQPGDTLAVHDVVDWILYLGPTEQEAEAEKAIYLDRAYVRELYRRSKIVSEAFGFDLTSNVRNIDPDLR
jgi:hypothetical protein